MVIAQSQEHLITYRLDRSKSSPEQSGSQNSSKKASSALGIEKYPNNKNKNNLHHHDHQALHLG